MTAQEWAAVFANQLTRADRFAPGGTPPWLRNEKKGDGVDTNEGDCLCPTPARQTKLETMRGSANVKPICVALVVAALALMPSEGLAWGRDGHQVVANLAQSWLSPQARKGVAALLYGATLGSVSTYADNYRNNHPETARWHFVNIPLGDGPYNPARDCAPSPEGDCIIAAIDRFTFDPHGSIQGPGRAGGGAQVPHPLCSRPAPAAPCHNQE